MTLGSLVASTRLLAPDALSLTTQAGAVDTPVTAIAHDSLAVTPGTVFVAVPGQRADGAAFAAQAVAAGAVAVVAETAAPEGVHVPWLRTTASCRVNSAPALTPTLETHSLFTGYWAVTQESMSSKKANSSAIRASESRVVNGQGISTWPNSDRSPLASGITAMKR